eukprot:364286-Chlamydomonas_euryale.AAC.4
MDLLMDQPTNFKAARHSLNACRVGASAHAGRVDMAAGAQGRREVHAGVQQARRPAGGVCKRQPACAPGLQHLVRGCGHRCGCWRRVDASVRAHRCVDGGVGWERFNS